MTSTNSNTNYVLFLSLLQKCPLDHLQTLFHHLIDIFCGQQNSMYNSFSEFYTLIEWWNLIDESKLFLKNVRNSDISVQSNLQLLSNEYCEIIKTVIDLRSSDLESELIEKSHSISPAYLKAFDWKLKLTLASDKMSQINEPRLLLDLDISGNKDESLLLDLDKDELKSLIETMEKIKSAVVELKTVDS